MREKASVCTDEARHSDLQGPDAVEAELSKVGGLRSPDEIDWEGLRVVGEEAGQGAVVVEVEVDAEARRRGRLWDPAARQVAAVGHGRWGRRRRRRRRRRRHRQRWTTETGFIWILNVNRFADKRLRSLR